MLFPTVTGSDLVVGTLDMLSSLQRDVVVCTFAGLFRVQDG